MLPCESLSDSQLYTTRPRSEQVHWLTVRSVDELADVNAKGRDILSGKIYDFNLDVIDHPETRNTYSKAIAIDRIGGRSSWDIDELVSRLGEH
jgi:hypothetical protein